MTVGWQRSSEAAANFWVWEKPKVGCRYIIPVDLAEGEDQTKGSDPDCHVALVLRDGYLDHNRLLHKPAVVARVRPPCRLPMIRLAKLVWMLSYYYGKCVVIPEMNNSGLSFIMALRCLPWSPSIWQRTEIDPHSGIERSWDGWRTTDSAEYRGLRSAIIDNLQEIVLGKGLECWCPHLHSELVDFVNKGGRREAGSGHDDDVMALAIGLYNLRFATPYVESARSEYIPPDMRRLLAEETDSGAGLSMRF